MRQYRTGRRGQARAAACRSLPGEAIYSKEGFAAALAAARRTSSTRISATAAVSLAMLDIAAMAQPHAVAVAPHNYNSTLVGLAATVQLSAMIPNFWIAECFVNLKPACDEIAVTPLVVRRQFRRSAHHAGHRHRPGRGEAACEAVPRHGHAHGQGAALLHRGVSAQTLRCRGDANRILNRLRHWLELLRGGRQKVDLCPHVPAKAGGRG